MRYRLLNPLDLPAVDEAVLLSGAADGVAMAQPGERRIFHAHKPAFYDDPDGTNLFQTFRDHAVHAPPAFLAAASRVTLAGFRAVLTADGHILGDAGFLGARDRAERTAALASEHGEDSRLRHDPDDDSFTTDLADRAHVHLTGTIVLLTSAEPSNYGSFIFRVLPKLVAAARFPANARFLVYRGPASYTQLLELAGIPEERLISHDPNLIYDIDRILIPGMRNPSAFIDPETRGLFAAMQAACGPSPVGRRIYVSRLRLSQGAPRGRVMVNEAELVASLAGQGFDIVQPETMSAREQIAAFAGADLVVGPSGAAMFNSVFCRPGTRLIDIESEPHWIYAHMCLFASSRLEYGIVAGRVLEPRPAGVHLPWRLNIPPLLERIAAFDSPRPPSAAARYDTAEAGMRMPDAAAIMARHWQFSRLDGSLIAPEIYFEADGRVAGYRSANEASWRFDGGFLEFINEVGEPTTRFDRIAQNSAGACVLSGRFLAVPGGDAVHVLTEQPGRPARQAVHRPRFAVLVRTHLVTEKLHDLLGILRQGHGYDLFVCADETRGKLTIDGVSVIGHSTEMCKRLGLVGVDRQPDLLWYFGDYALYCAYESIKEYDYYIMIEYDVEFVDKTANLLERLIKNLESTQFPYDFISTQFGPANKNWGWIKTCPPQLTEKYQTLFPFIIFSKYAIDYLLACRRQEAAGEMPAEGFAFCEVFVPSALMSTGSFRCADLNTVYADAWHPDSFGVLNLLLMNALPAHAAKLALAHPVFSEREYVARRLAEARRDGQTEAFIAFLEGPDAQIIDAGLRARTLAELRPPTVRPELHCLYTADHLPLLIRFLSSLRDELAVSATEITGTSIGGGPGGRAAIGAAKTNLLRDLSNPNRRPGDGIVLVTDIDIVFHDRILPMATECLMAHDVVFQREVIGGEPVNIGVIAFRPGPAVHAFWQEVNRQIAATGRSGHAVVNALLADHDAMARLGVRAGCFPPGVFCTSMGLHHAVYGGTHLHHANSHPTLREKWLALSAAGSVLAPPADGRAGDLRGKVLAGLLDAEWTFGALGRPEPYGTLRLAPDGRILGYHHPNESRYALAAGGLVFIGADGGATTLFDEFYVDPVGRRLMMVGTAPCVAPAASPHIHYLIADSAA